MRLLCTIFLSLFMFSCRGLAQDNDITTATSALQGVLANLQQSVQQLSLNNDRLTNKDKDIKQQIASLQAQLAQLEAKGEQLGKAQDKLSQKSPRRSQQITRLEQENFDLDDHIQKDDAEIKLIQLSLEAGYKQDQALLLQLKALTNLPPPAPKGPTPETLAAIRRQKEKLKLMKMINESQLRQEALHQSILEAQKNEPLQPVASALAHQEILKGQIKDLEKQIAAYPPDQPSKNIGIPDQWDNTQLSELQAELKTLEKNYAQLKDLMGEMTKKAKAAKMTVNQHIEEVKLQSSLNDLNHQGTGLRVDLDDLRSQMVDLDKRKSRLEGMIQQLP